MNAKQFLILLNKGNSLQKEDFQALVRLHETFPFFVIPKILAAKYELEKTGGESLEILHWAAVQSPDRIRLKQLVEQQIEFLPPAIPLSEESAIDESLEVETSKAPIDPFREQVDPDSTIKTREELVKRLEENLIRFKKTTEKKEESNPEPPNDNTVDEDLIATIKKKEKKIIVDARKREQNDLIKAFSKKKSLKLDAIQENQDAANLADLSQNSTTINDKIISEAFAKLLIKQNKKDQAIEIYQKLMLKFPNKTAYFAALIKELED